MNKLYLLTFNGLLINFEYEARIYLLGVFDRYERAQIEIEEVTNKLIKKVEKMNNFWKEHRQHDNFDPFISEEDLKSLFKITETSLNDTLELKDNINLDFDSWSDVVTEKYLGGATI